MMKPSMLRMNFGRIINLNKNNSVESRGVKRGVALRKGRREREKLAEESTTWRPVIKPYRRGQ